MRIIYLIAAYNEGSILKELVNKFSALSGRDLNFEVYIIDNASADDSKSILDKLALKNQWLHPLFTNNKGLGIAFKVGLRELKNRNFLADDWIIFSAADLPFNFSDLDYFLEHRGQNKDCDLFIGSKYHKNSQVKRSLKRLLGSYVFFFLRVLILQLYIKDTQGTIFLRACKLDILEKIKADDYFFTTELVYKFRLKTSIVEMPVIYEESSRPSKVNLVRDGIKSMRQMIKLKFS